MVRMVELVEGDVARQVDGDGKRGMRMGEVQWWSREMRVRWECWRDREMMRWVWWDWERTRVWGGFLAFDWPSGVVRGVSGSRSAGWSGSWGLPSENPLQNQRRPWCGG